MGTHLSWLEPVSRWSQGRCGCLSGFLESRESISLLRLYGLFPFLEFAFGIVQGSFSRCALWWKGQLAVNPGTWDSLLLPHWHLNSIWLGCLWIRELEALKTLFYLIFSLVRVLLGTATNLSDSICKVGWQVFFFFFLLFRLHLWHVAVPRLGVDLERQLSACTTATVTWDLSHVCHLHHSSRQHQILNPLRDARDKTHNLMVTSQICHHCATTGTPDMEGLYRLI